MKKIFFTFVLVLFATVAFSADSSPYITWLTDFNTRLQNGMRTGQMVDIDEMTENIPEARADDYVQWFENFYFPEFYSCEPNLSKSEKERLDRLIRVKPSVPGTGRHYDVFINRFFEMMDKFAPLITANEDECIRYLFAARPDLRGSHIHYGLYINKFDEVLYDYEPLISSHEETVLNYLLDIRPEMYEQNYSEWLTVYNKYYDKYEPFFNDNEKKVLSYIEKLMPEGQNEPGDDEFYKVSRERLMKIRYYIIRGQYNNAQFEVEDILGISE